MWAIWCTCNDVIFEKKDSPPLCMLSYGSVLGAFFYPSYSVRTLARLSVQQVRCWMCWIDLPGTLRPQQARWASSFPHPDRGRSSSFVAGGPPSHCAIKERWELAAQQKRFAAATWPTMQTRSKESAAAAGRPTSGRRQHCDFIPVPSVVILSLTTASITGPARWRAPLQLPRCRATKV
jgi:hypothetical protein